MRLIQSGSRRAQVMLVGEAPGADEDRIGRPFVGAAGYELDRELGQAHWSRNAFFITNVCHTRPPSNEIELFFAKRNEAKREAIDMLAGRFPRQPILDGLAQLQFDIDAIQPTLILALGNTALWALTGQTGILKWRGSIMPATGGPIDGRGIKTIIGLHPAYVLREQVYRFIAIADLQRAKHESEFPEIKRPTWHFTIPRPNHPTDVRDWFGDQGLLNDNAIPDPYEPNQKPLAADVENIRGSGDLICLGFASNEHTAICIPFIHRTVQANELDDDGGGNPAAVHFWSNAVDEVEISLLCRRMLRQHPILFHNGLHDCQILSRHWGCMPRFEHDSMVMQHVAYPGMLGGKIDPITGEVDKKGSSLSLSFCSSLYCDYHKFWKDDGRGWNPDIHDEAQYWAYNCEDTVRTYEVFNKLLTILRRDNLWEQYLFQMSLFPSVFDMMFRGVAFDDKLRHEYIIQVEREQARIQQWIDVAVGHKLNVGASAQMKALFYDDLQCKKILHRKTKQPTLDDKALERIARTSPILKPLIERIQALRTLNVFHNNFLKAKLRPIDGRLCGAFNVAFVETMRFSSNEDAFGGGLNLQNLPRNPDD